MTHATARAARLVITAVLVEGCSQAEAARRHGASPGWVSKLMARYRVGRSAGLELADEVGGSPVVVVEGEVDRLLGALVGELDQGGK
jgi:transposase